MSCGEPLMIRVGSYSVYTGTGTLTLSFAGDACEVPCPGDTNADQLVNVVDLLGRFIFSAADSAGKDSAQ